MLTKIKRIMLYKNPLLIFHNNSGKIFYISLINLLPQSILVLLFHFSTPFSQLEKTWKILMNVILPSVFSQQRVNDAVSSHVPCGNHLKLLQLTCTQNKHFFYSSDFRKVSTGDWEKSKSWMTYRIEYFQLDGVYNYLSNSCLSKCL